MTKTQPNFDQIARPYRWLEYLTLGRTLERCRLHFLSQLAGRSRAVVLGDGDGRFLSSLYQQNPTLRTDAVDISSAMLSLLKSRCPSGAALSLHHSNALDFLARSASGPYDLVVTHFFLDCLSQSEVDRLVCAATGQLVPGALWIVSDFRIPSGRMRLPARLLVAVLYRAFWLLTGLRVSQLPDHAGALVRGGFMLRNRHLSFCGMLTSELWVFDNPD